MNLGVLATRTSAGSSVQYFATVLGCAPVSRATVDAFGHATPSAFAWSFMHTRIMRCAGVRSLA